jgi:hypothetical protein
MNIENLKLIEKTKKLHQIELYEIIDIDILDKLLKSDLLKIVNYNKNNYDNERNFLLDYRKLFVDNKAKIKYVLGEIPFGRVLPLKNLGFHCLRRALRHTLAKNKYVDIDIINCHYTILNQICNLYKLENKKIDYYCKNRKDVIEMIKKHYKIYEDDKIKNLFIVLLYGSTLDNWKKENNVETNIIDHDFLLLIVNELQNIREIIKNSNPELVKMINKKNNKNKNNKNNNISGSCLSYFLQEKEYEILETIYYFCINKGIIKNNIASLCADGIMILKENYNDNILNEFTCEVKKITGFDIEFKIKDMNEDYLEILDEHILENNILDREVLGANYNIISLEKYDKFKLNIMEKLFADDIRILEKQNYIKNIHLTNSFKYFSKFHIYFYLEDAVYKIDDGLDPYLNFKNSFEQLYIPDDKKNIKFTKLYLSNSKKNSYSKMRFYPNIKEIDDTFNLFTGFKYDKKPEKINLDVVNKFIEHIKYLCKNEEKVYNYIIKWIAHIIQKPEKKTNVAIIFYSIIEGIGKNIFTSIISKLLYSYSGKFKNTDSITDKFNGDLFGKILMVGDEINTRAKKISDELKDIITRNEETIEFKNKNKLHNIPDFKNYIFTTNNENVFKISNTNRRLLFIECPEELRNSIEYDELYSICDNEEALINIHYYLKNIDLTNYETRNIPTTEYKRNLIYENMPAYYKFIKDDVGSYCGYLFKSVELYKHSIEYAKKNRMQSTYSEKLFYVNFMKVFGDYNKIKKGISYYEFPLDLDEIIDDLIKTKYIIN